MRADAGLAEQGRRSREELLAQARQALRQRQEQSGSSEIDVDARAQFTALAQAIDDTAHAALEEQRALAQCAREVREDAQACLAAERWLARLQARLQMAEHALASEQQHGELAQRFARCQLHEPRAHELLFAVRLALEELEDLGDEADAAPLADADFIGQGVECERTLTRERLETSAAKGLLRAMNRDAVRGEERLRALLRG